jgi:hypothetical protein
MHSTPSCQHSTARVPHEAAAAKTARFRIPVQDWRLLASQRIEIDSLIRGSTLNPKAFRWAVLDSETTAGARITRLEYGSAPAPAFFQFDRYGNGHYAVYSWDGSDECEEHCTGDWPQQALHVARWLAHLVDHERRNGYRLSLTLMAEEQPGSAPGP